MNNLFKIVQITPYYPPHLGGMENCVAILSKILVARKYDVTVYTSTIGHKAKNISNSTVSTHYLKAIEVAHTPIIFTLLFKLLQTPKKSIFHLHIAQAFTPEIVYLAAKIRGIPYVAHIHLDVDSSGKLGFLLEPYKKYILSFVLKRANSILCLSKKQGELIAKKYTLDTRKILIAPNGVGKDYYIQKRKNKNKIPRLLFVGRLAQQKNLTLLINTVSKMKTHVILDIVGEGEEKYNLEKLIKNLRLKNVFLHGTKTGPDLIRYYKDADLYVLSSEKEGVSLSMLEAMAAGLPIICKDAPGIRELITGNGIAVKKATPLNFSRAIDELLLDSKKITLFQKNAVYKAKKYTWENMASIIEVVYKQIQHEN